MESVNSERIYEVTNVLLRLNMWTSKVRGQCYDSASMMTAVKSGVVARVYTTEPRAFFTHCYGHALNLACATVLQRN